MEIQYTITETDYVQSAKLDTVPSRNKSIAYGTAGFLLLLLAVLGPDNWKGICYSVLICGVLGYFLFLYLFTPMQAKNRYRGYTSDHTPITFAAVESGCTLTTGHGQKSVPWESLLKWREDKNCVLVYFAPDMYYPIPKRLAESGFDLEGFRTLLRNKLGTPV